MEPILRLGRCLSDPLAVRILAILAERNVSTVQIRRELGLSSSALEGRLRKLREAELIEMVGPIRSSQLTLSGRFAPMVFAILAEYTEFIDWDFDLTTVRARYAESGC